MMGAYFVLMRQKIELIPGSADPYYDTVDILADIFRCLTLAADDRLGSEYWDVLIEDTNFIDAFIDIVRYSYRRGGFTLCWMPFR